MTLRGTVTKLLGSTSLVDVDGRAVECDLRARLFRREGVRLAVGDEVEVALPDDPEPAAPPSAASPAPPVRGMIEAVLPRRSALRRARDFKRDQVVCANVERVVIVTAALDPPYKRAFIDRLVVAAERDGLLPVVVVNKLDLCDAEYARFVRLDLDVYGALGYPTLAVSAETGEGMAALADLLSRGISAVVGPSGVGKSTLLNAVCPGLRLRTGDVSEHDGRGRHTTTAAELVRLPRGGWVIDTPGLRAFGLWDLEPAQVLSGFRDVAEVAQGCRFGDCRHGGEPGCAARAAVAAGDLDEERLQSYLKLRDEVEAEAAARQSARRR